MKIHSNDFRVREGDDVDLKKWPTKVAPVYKSKDRYKELLQDADIRHSAMCFPVSETSRVLSYFEPQPISNDRKINSLAVRLARNKTIRREPMTFSRLALSWAAISFAGEIHHPASL